MAARRYRLVVAATTSDEVAPIIDDDELTALALAADPDAPVDDDARPLTEAGADGLLPAWYMPAPTTRRRLTGWRRRVALLSISSFIAINAYGLCSTYGSVGLR